MRSRDDEPSERHSHVEVVIPTMEIVEESTNQSVLPSQRGLESKQDSVSKDSEEVEKNSASLIEIDNGENKAAKEVGNGNEESSEKPDKLVGKEKTKYWPEQTQSFGSGPSAAANISQAVAPKHKRFDSEEPAVKELVEFVPRTEVAPSEDKDEDSDSDAPEVVQKHDAQERARRSALAASKAAEE
jgi:hypothetical protein